MADDHMLIFQLMRLPDMADPAGWRYGTGVVMVSVQLQRGMAAGSGICIEHSSCTGSVFT